MLPVLALAMAGSMSVMAGSITSYNLYVMNNLQAGNSDVAGSTAVGGNATLTSMDLGLNTVGSDPDLVVGGDLTAVSGTVHGTTVVGGTVSTSGGWTTTTMEPSGTPLPVNFATESARLLALSNLIAAQTSLGSGSLSFGTLTLTASNPGINVFDIDQTTLSSITSLRINAAASTTVLVNVNGTAGNMSFLGMSLSGGITETHVLYNFYNATTLDMNGIGLLGSVMAPLAEYHGTSGVVLGQVIVKDFVSPSSAIQINNYAFTGDLPVAAVPEPATWSFVLMGIGGLAAWRRRRG